MTPEDEADLKANIRVLLDLVREEREANRQRDARIAIIMEDIAYIKGRLANTPESAEFYELRGRVEEISRRLPIAYAPPAARGGE